jgi:uncharacterized RDD family membrane protein YckC
MKKQKKPIVYRRDYVTIETADKIKIDYRIANPLLRLGAFLIDWVLMLILFLFILYFLSLVAQGNDLGRIFDQEHLEGLTYAFYFLILFILRWGYYLFFEMFFEGKTPGKFLCGIRTIHYRGKHLDLSTLVLRNFARLLDEIDFCISGFICMLINREYRRIGDLLADTIVVKDERVPVFEKAFSFTLPAVNVPPELLKASFLHRLTEEELYVLRRFLTEQSRIPLQRRTALTADLARTVKMKIQDRADTNDPLSYLLSVYRRHEESHAVK